MVEYNYEVTYLATGKDISSSIEVVECTETGTGEINSAMIRLNAEFGAFITNANSGDTPILDEFDQIRIKITDDQTPIGEYNKVYEVETLVPIENTQEGNVLEVQLLGQETHLQKVHFAKQFYFEKSFNVIRDIIDFYLEAKGSAQPTVEDYQDPTPTGGNDAPQFVVNNFEFNLAEKFAYDGIVEVVDSLGASISANGAGDFFEVQFENGTNKDAMSMEVFSSGTRPPLPPPPEVVITDVDGVNEDPTEGGIDALTGTMVVAWGAEEFGSLPPETMRFEGELEAFQLYPTFVGTNSWPTDSRVQFAGVVYENQGASTTNVPPNPPWVVVTQADVVGGGSAEYSPWTKDKITFWIDSAGDPLSISGPVLGVFTSTNSCWWDSNLIINDRTHYRNHAEFRAVSTGSIPSFLFYPSGFYRGFRVLVDTNIGVPSGAFAGTDSFGRTFADNIAQWNGTEWFVVRAPSLPNGTEQEIATNDFQVAIIQECNVYQYHTVGGWIDVSATSRANDCFHKWETCQNAQGIVNIDNGGGGLFSDNSAVMFRYEFTGFQTVPINPVSDNYYSIGAWIGIRFPFPVNTYNGVGAIGNLYGNNNTKREPVTIDPNNMHLTHSGLVGFNNVEAEDLGMLGGIRMNMSLKWNSAIVDNISPQGNFRMKCIMYDINDNAVAQDFTIQFNDHFEQIMLPFAGFKVYRGRTPLQWGDILQAIVLEDVEILNVFQWRNINKIVWQWDEVYDDAGRYSPESGRVPILSLPNASVEIAIDKFGFYKPLIATTSVGIAPASPRDIEPRFLQRPLVSNYVQLQQLAQSQLELEGFRHKQYEIRTEGRIDIRFGEFFKLNKQFLVNDSDGAPDTIQLVAKKIKYKISKPRDAPGHFERMITGVKRFT